MTSFAARLAAKIKDVGPLCVGIDPSTSILQSCSLPDTAEGAFRFAQRVLEASDGKLSIVKPQCAFFERFGSAGWQALERATTLARSMGILVLLDGKRGDIDTTAEAYGHTFFTPAAPLFADAITVHAYLGFGALKRLLDVALKNEGGVFVVVRSSNPEGEALQLARMANGNTVAGDLALTITTFNQTVATAGLGPVGAVVGATCTDADGITQMMPQSFILAPGVGAQGATIADIVTRMPSARGRVLPSVSRGILSNGTTVPEIRSALAKMNREAIRVLVD